MNRSWIVEFDASFAWFRGRRMTDQPALETWFSHESNLFASLRLLVRWILF